MFVHAEKERPVQAAIMVDGQEDCFTGSGWEYNGLAVTAQTARPTTAKLMGRCNIWVMKLNTVKIKTRTVKQAKAKSNGDCAFGSIWTSFMSSIILTIRNVVVKPLSWPMAGK